jgi:hypothetical protein
MKNISEKSKNDPFMFARLLPLLLLGSSLLVPMQGVSAAPPTIELVVPSYNYPHAEATLGEGIANDGTIVGLYVFLGTDAGYFRLPNGHFSPPISVRLLRD